jgi:hypothetical protein
MKKILIGVAVVVVIVVIAIVYFVRSGPGAGTGAGITAENPSVAESGVPSAGGITSVVLDPSAYSIALARAATWEPDAALTKMETVGASGNDQWQFIFVSKKSPGNAFQITTNDGTITGATQVKLAGGGASLPANAISPDAAIAEFRAIPGYATATITSVTMIYSATAQTWYWGIQTATEGAITLSATP